MRKAGTGEAQSLPFFARLTLADL